MLASNRPLELKKGLRWQCVQFNPTFAKYFRVSFLGNYGHPGQLAVQQIRFLRCKEFDAKILTHPQDKYTFEVGPSMPGQVREDVMSCLDGLFVGVSLLTFLLFVLPPPPLPLPPPSSCNIPLIG